MNVPPERWAYRLSLAPFNLGFLIPLALVFRVILVPLLLLLLIVYTIYALALLLIVNRYLTRIEMKDLRFTYFFTIIATFLVLVPLVDATNINTMMLSVVDFAVIIVSAAALLFSNGVFREALALGRGVRNVGRWKDSAAEIFSNLRGYAFTLGALVIFVALLSLMLLVYVFPVQTATLQQALVLEPVTANSYYLPFALILMNVAVYSVVMLFLGIAYAVDFVSERNGQQNRR